MSFEWSSKNTTFAVYKTKKVAHRNNIFIEVNDLSTSFKSIIFVFFFENFLKYDLLWKLIICYKLSSADGINPEPAFVFPSSLGSRLCGCYRVYAITNGFEIVTWYAQLHLPTSVWYWIKLLKTKRCSSTEEKYLFFTDAQLKWEWNRFHQFPLETDERSIEFLYQCLNNLIELHVWMQITYWECQSGLS